jgi:ribosome-associated protein
MQEHADIKKRTNSKKTIRVDETMDLVRELCSFLDDKKAEKIVVLDLQEVNSYFRYFIIATASSRLHLRSLAQQIRKNYAHLFAQKKSVGSEDSESGWIVVDFIDPVMHLFLKDEREFYDLERLWGDAKRISVKRATRSGE